MFVCFKDKGVTKNGGIDPNTDVGFMGDLVHQREAKDKCAKIVFVQVEIEESSAVQAGVGYLKAGNEAGYKKLFTLVADRTTAAAMDVMNMEDAIEEYKGSAQDAERFLDLHGRYWYFCKCKVLNCSIMK